MQNHTKILNILYCWRIWKSVEAPQAWVKKLIRSREGLLIFLKAVLHQSASQGVDDYVAKITWYIQLKTIEDFIPVNVLEKKIKEIEVDKITTEAKRAVDAFHKALKRRQAGRSDDDWRHDDED